MPSVTNVLPPSPKSVTSFMNAPLTFIFLFVRPFYVLLKKVPKNLWRQSVGLKEKIKKLFLNLFLKKSILPNYGQMLQKVHPTLVNNFSV